MPVSYFFMYFLFNIFNPIKMCKEKRKEKEFTFIKKKRCVLFDRKKRKESILWQRAYKDIFKRLPKLWFISSSVGIFEVDRSKLRKNNSN